MEFSKNNISTLTRQYYENDEKGFYVRNEHLNCWEQMCYQSIRHYNLDFGLLFCDDISPAMVVYQNKNQVDLYANELEINVPIFDYKLLTKEYENSINKIETGLRQGKIIIFNTFFDSLETYKWYKLNGQYTRNKHYSLIIGMDDEDFYYIDSPPTRNPASFRKHPENSSVGLLNKQVLLNSFKYGCEVGYIDIQESALRDYPPLYVILKKIVSTYNDDRPLKESGRIIYRGKKAIHDLIIELEKDTEFSIFTKDEFRNIIFYARCKRLKRYIEADLINVDLNLKNETIAILEEITSIWKVTAALIEKNNIKKIIDFKQRQISYYLKLEKLMQCFIQKLKRCI